MSFTVNQVPLMRLSPINTTIPRYGVSAIPPSLVRCVGADGTLTSGCFVHHFRDRWNVESGFESKIAIGDDPQMPVFIHDQHR